MAEVKKKMDYVVKKQIAPSYKEKVPEEVQKEDEQNLINYKLEYDTIDLSVKIFQKMQKK